MRRPTPLYVAEATALVEEKIRSLQQLSYAQASVLPESDGADVIIAGKHASLTTFRYTDAYQLEGRTLVVVMAALPGFLGMTSFHIERGLVFSPMAPYRAATELELQNSGG